MLNESEQKQFEATRQEVADAVALMIGRERTPF
jgi:hypothetical protein